MLVLVKLGHRLQAWGPTWSLYHPRTQRVMGCVPPAVVQPWATTQSLADVLPSAAVV